MRTAKSETNFYSIEFWQMFRENCFTLVWTVCIDMVNWKLRFLARDVLHLALMLRCQCPSVCPVCLWQKCIGAL